MRACNQAKIRYIELPIAFDAITVVVNPQNDWLERITLEELKQIWSPRAEKNITRWNQFRADLPNRPLNLYGPGADSGTFDYFTEAVMGKAGASRSDYLKSEDDEILVQGVSQDPNALGYTNSLNTCYTYSINNKFPSRQGTNDFSTQFWENLLNSISQGI